MNSLLATFDVKTYLYNRLYNLNDMTVATEKMTYQAFREMNFPEDDTSFYELLNGVLVRKSAPSVQHQRAVRKTYDAISAYVRNHNSGEILFAPIDVKLSEYNVPQPDLLYIKAERISIINEDDGYVNGAPDLIIEVISPSSVKRDRIEKMALYAKYKVSEYWLVDPLNKAIEVYVLKKKEFELLQFAESTDLLESKVLAGFSVSVEILL